jgi:hypothetical protein
MRDRMRKTAWRIPAEFRILGAKNPRTMNRNGTEIAVLELKEKLEEETS